MLNHKLLAILVSAPALYCQTSSFVTFRFSGDTVARGINYQGQIVGHYLTGGKWRGFLRAADGSILSIDLPGAANTYLHGINDQGDMVLWDGVSKSYLRSAAGALTEIVIPNSLNTVANGINNSGSITGTYFRAVRSTRGFIRKPDGTVIDLFIDRQDAPPVTDSYVEGRAINRAGLVAELVHLDTPPGPGSGTTNLYDIPRGFVTSFNFWDNASALGPIIPNGISDAGTVVGTLGTGTSYVTTGSQSIVTGTINAEFTVPNSVKTFAQGINGSGQIVGYSQDGSGQLSGFLMNPCQVNLPQTSVSVLKSSGDGVFEVRGQTPCIWFVEGTVPWISPPAGPGNGGRSVGNGNGFAAYQYSENYGHARQGIIKVGSRDFILSQASGCIYGILAGISEIAPTGGTFPLSVQPFDAPPSAAECSVWTMVNKTPWLQLSGTPGTGPVTFQASVTEPNLSEDYRGVILNVDGFDYTSIVKQRPVPCTAGLSTTAIDMPANGGSGTVTISIRSQCSWRVLVGGNVTVPVTAGQGNGTISFQVSANPFATPRRSGFSIASGQQPSAGYVEVTINQPGATSCNFQLTPDTFTIGQGGGPAQFIIDTLPTCAWTAASDVPWIKAPGGTQSMSGTGQAVPTWTVEANPDATARQGKIRVADKVVTINQVATNRQGFLPVSPCRLMDTRADQPFSGQWGPPSFRPGETRVIPVAGRCGIPASARAVSANVTVVPKGFLGFLTVWPSGPQRPVASTLNSWNGRVVANAAIVAIGSGAISIYATDETDVLVDVNGFFAEPSVLTLTYHPVTPCRLVDTRTDNSILAGNSKRDIPIASDIPTNGKCRIPSSAEAFSLNATVVPSGSLGYLTLWPAGQGRPLVSTLNSWNGQVVANAAIVPASASGAISVFASDTTHLVLDINGYFARIDPSEGLYYSALGPCRIADTRDGQGFTGAFGPPMLSAQTNRTMVPQSANCNVPAAAKAYVFNATVVPAGFLGYLSLFPTGPSFPLSSTLNSWDGQVTANMAIVPDAGQGITALSSDRTHVVLDLNGYFSP